MLQGYVGGQRFADEMGAVEQQDISRITARGSTITCDDAVLSARDPLHG